MLGINRLKWDASYKEIFQKGTLALLTTFGAGLLFGSENMMIAFVLIIGSNVLAQQNLCIKTVHKLLRLIGIDLVIVGTAFIASLHQWVAIPINFVTLFLIIYLTVSPYNQMSYKTFMMLFVFCQYTSVPLADLPSRMIMVMVTVTIIVMSIYLEQRRVKALLSPQIGESFKLLAKQFSKISQGTVDEELARAVTNQMNELAYLIYTTGYRRYFTTYIGKVHFHFYLNISYLNVLLDQVKGNNQNRKLSQENILSTKQLFEQIESYFNRTISRKVLIEKFDSYLSTQVNKEGFEEEIMQVIYALKKNFIELETLHYKEKNKPYNGWKRSELSGIKSRVKKQFTLRSMSFNFALRMASVLTFMLFLAPIVGFYKFIWVIIPIMSITQPYYEETKRRKKDRIKSNILASIGIALLMNGLHVRWVAIGILILAFYLIYAYKDYYHMSIFLTIISMSVASVSKGINALVIYRIIYVLIGAGIVEVVSRLKPYKLEHGIDELKGEIYRLSKILKDESKLTLHEKADFNRIREAIIYLAILCYKLDLKNRQYQSEEVQKVIKENREYSVRIGHWVLRNP